MRVEIHWIDAMGGDGGWVDPDSMDKFSNRIETFGFLVSETKDAYIVSSSRCCENGLVLSPIKIPKIAILSYREIAITTMSTDA